MRKTARKKPTREVDGLRKKEGRSRGSEAEERNEKRKRVREVMSKRGRVWRGKQRGSDRES